MILLNRYIGRAVITNTLLTVVVLVIVSSFFVLVDELDDVGDGAYSTGHALLYTALGIPQQLHEFLPVATLIGSLLGLGGLARNNELTAARASGVSVRQILLAALRAGLLIMVFSFVMSEWVAPPAERYAQQLRAYALQGNLAVRTDGGYWARDGKNFVNVREVLPDKGLRGVEIYEFDDDKRLTLASFADRAQFRGDHWVLRDVEQTRFHREGTQVQNVEEVRWQSVLNPQVLEVLAERPENLTLWGLYQYIRYLDANGLDASTYRLGFWHKVLRPVELLVMLVLAIPFVFGSQRNVSVGQGVLVGTLLGVAYWLLGNALGQIGLVYGLNMAISVGFPPLLFFALAIWLYRRVRCFS